MKVLPRILIAGGGSGSGKTTVTCALLSLFIRRGLKVAAFKCGPDYIDPMFHREMLGANSSNLDLFILGEDTARRLLLENSRNSDIAVLEGVMGFYDGVGGNTTEASSWHLSQVSETPVLLVENCKGQSLTLAARIKGILEFRSNNIRAVLLNNAGEDFFKTLKPVIEKETGLPVVGFLPHVSDCTIESRHLGLVTAEEIEDLRGKIGRLADTIEKTVDINALLSIAASAPPLKTPPASKGVFTVKTRYRKRVRIGVARDKAFCFYYDDGLVLLKEMGAELLDFSPLSAEKLPSGLDGLILGGGYPELYAAELSANKTMLAAIKSAVDGGIPTIAECGGFMYLHREVEGADGVLYPLAAVIDACCENKRRLVRFGYAEFRANVNNLLCSEGGVLRGHEFHYWDSDCPGDAFTALKPVSGKSWKCVIVSETLLAGFPHFHFCSAPDAAERFLTICGA